MTIFFKKPFNSCLIAFFVLKSLHFVGQNTKNQRGDVSKWVRCRVLPVVEETRHKEWQWSKFLYDSIKKFWETTTGHNGADVKSCCPFWTRGLGRHTTDLL